MNEKMKNRLRRAILLPLMIFMMISCIPVSAQEDQVGAGIIGYITNLNDNLPSREPYYDFRSLVDAIAGYRNFKIKVEMATDWDASQDSQFNNRILIPAYSNVTLEMHGHMFNRDLVRNNNWKHDGELFYVENNAVFTIIGASNEEEKQTEHKNVYMFTNMEQSTARGPVTVNGACLTGGNSMDGPGVIYLDSGKTCTISDVTMIGNKAFYFFDPLVTTGYGGAILISEDNTVLQLNNCDISGNLAQEDGGGIYAANDDNIQIILDRTKIQFNYANSDGGGINMDGEKVSIIGKNGSEISCNSCKDYGGGVYFWNDEATLNGVTIWSNHAKKGGGVYTMEEDIELKNLVVKDNDASELGGGIYIENDYTTIENCIITDNRNYGVYIEKDCDVGMFVKGSTVIKDNARGNLTLQNGSSFISFNRDSKMDVHIGYVENPADAWGYAISPGPMEDYSNQLTADDSSYFIAYSYIDSEQDTRARRLRYLQKSQESDEKGHTRQEADIESVPVTIGSSWHTSQVYAGGYTAEEGGSGTEYEFYRLGVHHTSGGADSDSEFICFYSDGFFYEQDGTSNPFVYNNHLATASWGLAQSGAYLSSPAYAYKHTGARQFMADIGCPDQMIYVNDSNVSVPGTHTMGVTIGAKNLQKYEGDTLVDTGDVLIAIALRGANYEDEWAGNVTLGSGNEDRGANKKGEALGFSLAADMVMESVEFFIDRYGLKDKVEQGRVRFWISGFSRAGATANVTAKRLVETYCYDNDGTAKYGSGFICNQVFAYPLEAPKGGTDNAEMIEDKTRYYCIHNIINTGDVVPLVAPEEMGFKRYGVDHYIPGTQIKKDDPYNVKKTVKTVSGGDPAGIRTVTTYADNTPLSTKKNKDGSESDLYKQYVTRRAQMIKQLAAIDHTIYFYDWFYPFSFEYSWPPYGKFAKFDGAKVEDYLPDFMAFLQQEVANNRGRYAVEKIKVNGKEYETIQQLAYDYFAADDNENKRFQVLMDAVEKIISDWMTDIDLIYLLGNYYKASESGKENQITRLWNVAENAGAFNGLTAEEYSVVKKYWFTIADAAFRFTDGDYRLGDGGHAPGYPVFPTGKIWTNAWLADASELMYALTLVNNMDMIVDKNHNMEIGNAWTRTYDSYYTDKNGNPNYKQEFDVRWIDNSNPDNVDNYSVEKPSAYIADPEAKERTDGMKTYIRLAENDQSANVISGRAKVLLEIGSLADDANPADGVNTIGEAVYYDLYDITNGESKSEQLASGKIYRGGIDLYANHGDTAYKIVAYGYSYGVKSAEAVYYINIVTARHMVSLYNGGATDPYIFHYKEGEEVTFSASPPDFKYLTGWTVSLTDENGALIAEDIASAVLGGQTDNISVTFEMPTAGSDTYDGEHVYPDGYRLVLRAQTRNKISSLRTPTDMGSYPFDLPERPAPSNMNNLTHEINLYYWDDETGTYWSDYVYHALSWTYTYNGKTYPASFDEPVYGEVVYKASFVVPENLENGVVFTQHVSAACRTGGIDVTRSETDGSLYIEIEFEKTGHGPSPQNVEIPLVFVALNAFEPDKPVQYHRYDGVYPGKTVTLTSFDLASLQFKRWLYDDDHHDPYIKPVEGTDFTSKTISVIIAKDIPQGEHVIYAEYAPPVLVMQAFVDPPVGGEELQTEAVDDPDNSTLVIHLQGWRYDVAKENVEIIWSPAPMLATTSQKAAYLTAYTVSVRVKPSVDEQGEYIMVRRHSGPGYFERMPLSFVYSDDVYVEMNDEHTTFDPERKAVTYTFPITEYMLEKVYNPSDVTAIPYGSDKEAVKEYLPKTVQIMLEDGNFMDVPVTWNEPERAFDSSDIYDAKTWIAAGKVNLPYGVINKPGDEAISLDVNIHLFVDPAFSASAVEASASSGDYPEDQTVILSTETEDAVIYYTMDPEAGEEDDIVNDPKWIVYDGNEIAVNRADAVEDELDLDGNPTGRKQISLYTVAIKDGMRPSVIRRYIYVFSNEVEVPEGHDHQYNFRIQVGVKGDDYYTLSPYSLGVYINKEGDAVASVPGVYYVKAKIKDGFRWKIIDPQTGDITYTTDDQIIKFRIKLLDSEEDPESPDQEYTVSFDLNGGWLDDKEGTFTVTYVEGTLISMPKPEREGYEFDYWKGSKYEAGESYEIKENHTFTAQWKKTSGDDETVEPDEPDQPVTPDSEVTPDAPDTSDAHGSLIWKPLMIVSLLVSALAALFRRKLR